MERRGQSEIYSGYIGGDNVALYLMFFFCKAYVCKIADIDLSLSNINLETAINDLEEGRIDPKLLKIKIMLAKNPADYAVNNPNKRIGMLLRAKAGYVIWYLP